MESFLQNQSETQQHESSTSHSQATEDGSSASSDVRKGRGPQIIFEWGTGHMLHVEFDSTWEPIGPNV
ncbi:hypothetical protein Q3G72_024332 [Acer saccharum]|nr:hypothetical protein Q3G72_024332 [Acer saccharum]